MTFFDIRMSKVKHRTSNQLQCRGRMSMSASGVPAGKPSDVRQITDQFSLGSVKKFESELCQQRQVTKFGQKNFVVFLLIQFEVLNGNNEVKTLT